MVGTGSIGRRHLKNLRTLGIHSLMVWDPDPKQMSESANQFGAQETLSLESGLSERPSLVFLCSPPSFHAEQTLKALQAGSHVFVEKPISDSLEGIPELLEEAGRRKVMVQVGYNLRFLPALEKLKGLIEDDAVGYILWVYAEFGQFLPDWHPWEDYRKGYAARRELGGGILLDGSHELDYLLRLFGRPSRVMCMSGKHSSLEMNVEDSATLLLEFSNGLQVDVHMDFFQRAHTRTCKLVGEMGTLTCDLLTGKVSLYEAKTREWRHWEFKIDWNETYINEVYHFLQCVEQKTCPQTSLRDSVDVMRVVLAAKASAASGKTEEILW
jgi:predicted dehydrogenase